MLVTPDFVMFDPDECTQSNATSLHSMTAPMNAVLSVSVYHDATTHRSQLLSVYHDATTHRSQLLSVYHDATPRRSQLLSVTRPRLSGLNSYLSVYYDAMPQLFSLSRLTHVDNSVFHPSSVGKWVPALARKAGIIHSVSGCTWGVQVKLWDPLRMHAVPEVCLRQGTVQIHVYLASHSLKCPCSNVNITATNRRCRYDVPGSSSWSSLVR